ncbi:hypothetical protein DFP74_5789 [Nocardiopsis sp. Huas11]|uniref:hypothetical protein n=1 Tax=Nocardiopsis sp. Huas11 TaxID=2183912 RepID=UPI000F1627CC|nr:hypothetical protein [Nocardiopsis sp. Huas11]RKS10042.1 hypothetical protein DFP74_5789 [Nocardiopsis sp. Huas11]
MTRTHNSGPAGAPTPNRAEETGWQTDQDIQGDQDVTPQEVSPSVTDQPEGEQAASHRTPAAFASLYPPCARRRRWLFVYRCPRCAGHHQGLSWSGRVAGVRRSGCGRLVWVVVARQYRTPSPISTE